MPSGFPHPRKIIDIYGLSKGEIRRGKMIKEVIEDLIPEVRVDIHIGTERRKGDI